MSFDHLAPHYHWMERVLAGGRLQTCRTQFLPAVTNARRVLLAGEGHGRFLIACRQALPEAEITCLDASPAMHTVARETLAQAGLPSDRVQWVTADARAWEGPPNHFDLVVTNFFLDCFPPDQLANVVSRLARSASPSAHWLLTDFTAPAQGLARWRAEAILAMMYVFFRVVTRLPARRLTEPAPYLQQHGFLLRDQRRAEWGLLRMDWWSRAAVQPR